VSRQFLVTDSAAYTRKGKLRTARGYERYVRALKRELYTRDYDIPHHDDVLLDDQQTRNYWSFSRR
jgi:hypothetical protein